MKVSKFKKVILIVLILTTLLYPLIFKALFDAYKSWCYRIWVETLARFGATPEQDTLDIFYPDISFFDTVYGQIALYFGLAILISWAVYFIVSAWGCIENEDVKPELTLSRKE